MMVEQDEPVQLKYDPIPEARTLIGGESPRSRRSRASEELYRQAVYI